MKPVLLDVLRVTLSVAIPLAGFTTGLRAPVGDAASLWRHPARLARALFAVLVVVPLWALLLLQLVPLRPGGRAGILVAVLSVGLGPVASMNRLRGDSAVARRALELNISVLVASLLFVPLAFFGLAAAYHREVKLGWLAVARVVSFRALLPCLIGLLVARRRPHLAERIDRPASILVNITALLILALALILTGKVLAGVPPTTWFVCAAIAAGALAVGHLWTRDDPPLRPALATASVMRFPALALLLASATGQRALLMPNVLVYLLIGMAAEGLYRAAGRRRARRATGPAAPPSPLRARLSGAG